MSAWSVLEMIRPGLEWWKSPLPNPSISIKPTGALSTTNRHLPRALPATKQDLLELTPKKDVLFIIGDWNAKVGSQETPAVTGKFGLGMRNEAGQRLIEFCQENVLVIANTLFQQHKKTPHMDITRWSTPKSDGLYSLQPKMEKLYTVNKNKTRSWLWLRSWTPYYQIQTETKESRENH